MGQGGAIEPETWCNTNDDISHGLSLNTLEHSPWIIQTKKTLKLYIGVAIAFFTFKDYCSVVYLCENYYFILSPLICLRRRK